MRVLNQRDSATDIYTIGIGPIVAKLSKAALYLQVVRFIGYESIITPASIFREVFV
jgi:hypothetical protein